MKVKVKKLHPDAIIPEYKTKGAAGFDLYAVEDVIIEPGQTKLVRLGLAFEVPEGYEIQIRPRSGLSLKTKLRQSNSVGTIDSDYRGEVCWMVDNVASDREGKTDIAWTLDGEYVKFCEDVPVDTYMIQKGDRVCQGVIQKVIQADFEEAEELQDTERGTGGFGHTGVRK